MLDARQVDRFEEQGFLRVPGLLDPKAELAALDVAYQDLIETLACIHFVEAGERPPPAFRDRPVGERMALLEGASGGQALAHLDPCLTAGGDTDRHRSDLPSAQIPEIFQLLRAAPLLDALEALIGPEIDASPGYHLNFKLPARHLALARETARRLGRSDPTQLAFHDFFVGQTIWHRDVDFALPDAHDSRIVVAWIPMTPAGGERGSLVVMPGSHRDRRPAAERSEELREGSVELTADPGDVVFFDNWLLHASSPNRMPSDVRWVFNFRYLPRGQAAGRPHLPTVLLRSRSEPQRELRNPLLWSAIWQHALAHLAGVAAPVSNPKSLAKAQAITREWQRRTPDELAWLSLAGARASAAPTGASRRLGRALRSWIAGLRFPTKEGRS